MQYWHHDVYAATLSIRTRQYSPAHSPCTLFHHSGECQQLANHNMKSKARNHIAYKVCVCMVVSCVSSRDCGTRFPDLVAHGRVSKIKKHKTLPRAAFDAAVTVRACLQPPPPKRHTRIIMSGVSCNSPRGASIHQRAATINESSRHKWEQPP
eukprot:3076080-Rhodomonas_salina.2